MYNILICVMQKNKLKVIQIIFILDKHLLVQEWLNWKSDDFNES